MFRKSATRYIKPFLHALSPGARASEKGMLYRNSYQNAFARVSSLQSAQMNHRESVIRQILTVPDQVMIGVVVGVFVMFSGILLIRQQPTSFQLHKNKGFIGGLTENEMYKRRDEMGRIFEIHAEAIANTRAEIERPEVFSAPGEYVSSSGLYEQHSSASNTQSPSKTGLSGIVTKLRAAATAKR